MSTTVRISADRHRKLRLIALSENEPMQATLDKAIDAYDRERFLRGLAADFDRLRANPEAWAMELAERSSTEGTLMDDLDPTETWENAPIPASKESPNNA